MFHVFKYEAYIFWTLLIYMKNENFNHKKKTQLKHIIFRRKLKIFQSV